ncbi:MAG: hypothetical protein ACR2PR_00755 [Pseudohongiellaceae bacterium]
MKFTKERKAFDHLRDNYEQEVAEEYILAVGTVLERYNTTIYENRFVTGGAVEIFTCALLRSVGLECTLYASQERSGDLLLPGGRQISVKGTFTGGASNIKLVNQLGEGSRPWSTATIFVVSEVGLVYGDPTMVTDTHIKQVSDGVVLKRRGLQELMDDSNNVLPLNIPQKPSGEMTGFSHKASAAVAKQVMSDQGLKRLLAAFPERGDF